MSVWGNPVLSNLSFPPPTLLKLDVKLSMNYRRFFSHSEITVVTTVAVDYKISTQLNVIYCHLKRFVHF